LRSPHHRRAGNVPGNRYSVPASFANRPVSLRVYPDNLVVVAEGHVVCEHPRIIDRTHNGPGRTVYDWRHYLAVIQRKPGALNFWEASRAPAALVTCRRLWRDCRNARRTDVMVSRTAAGGSPSYVTSEMLAMPSRRRIASACRRCQPGPDGLHGAQSAAVWDGDLLPLPFLIGF
jgi:hypothetical protein